MSASVSRLCAAFVAVLVVGAMAPAIAAAPDARGHASAAERLSTPQLIEKAHAQGELSRFQADRFLAFAILDHERLPQRFVSDVPWRGTLPLLELRKRVAAMPRGPRRAALREILAAPGDGGPPDKCDHYGGDTTATTTHYRVDHSNSIGGGLSLSDYEDALEETWSTEVTGFGWAAPPLEASLSGKYHVVIANLGSSLYGFVTTSGTFAGTLTNNPNTAWAEPDAVTTCMVLNDDYTGFPGTPQKAMEATAAHEFNHSIQFGYGALLGSNTPDSSFVEGGATWMEDEVFDDSNDNHNYLWPVFSDDMGQYGASPYPYWITYRGLTERFGTGSAGAGEQVMEDFWEAVSQETHLGLNAMNHGLQNKGSTLAGAYHDYAIAARFMKPCGGSYALPYCFEEAAAYIDVAEPPPLAGNGGSVASVGAGFNGSIFDNYALNWVELPTSSSTYDVTLNNTSSGGQLRGTVVCDTGTALQRTPLPSVVSSGGSATLTDYDPEGCVDSVLVITNQSQTAANPSSSTSRTYSVQTAGEPPATADLDVTNAGTGTGTVTSSPGGINCGVDCSHTYLEGTPVVLTADPEPGSTFAGWSGDCTGTSTCNVTMSTNRSVTATFDDIPDPVTHSLTIAEAGTGTGSVQCSPACATEYDEGTEVTLTADPGTGSSFTGWSGDCTGTGDCVLTMDVDKAVTATFVDSSAPSAPALSSLGSFRTSLSIPLTWSASTDPESGIDSYTVERRTAPPNGTFGSYSQIGTTDATSMSSPGQAGSSYCFRVAATNGEGLSATSVERCTSLPVDDRGLTAVGRWARRTGIGYYLSTFTRSSTKGAVLKRSIVAKRVALVVTKCPTCGTVKVFLGTQLLKKVALTATTTKKKQVVSVATFTTTRSGTLRIKVVSSGKPVTIDGLGAGPL